MHTLNPSAAPGWWTILTRAARRAILPALLLAWALPALVLAAEPAAPPAPPAPQAPSAPAASPRVISDRWYVIQMGDEKAGHAHESQRTDEKGRIVTEQAMQFKIGRLGRSIEMKISSRFVETEAGEPVEMMSDQDLGLSTVRETYRFVGGKDGGVIHITESGGRKSQKPAERPRGEWLTPNAARRFVEEKLEAGEKEITVTVLDATSGLTPVVQTQKVVGPVNVEVMGKTVPAIEWLVTQSVMPGVETREFVDKRGVSVRTQIAIGGITLTMLESEKELALSPFSAPEMMLGTLVRPSRPIDNARDLRRAVYVVRSAPDAAGAAGRLELTGAGSQRIEPQADGSLRVTIDLSAPGAAAPEADAKDQRYRLASTMLDIDDPALIALTKQALEGIAADAPPALRAEQIRRFVHSYINDKNLGVGFASASEVCTTREGDCSEHGVLLAALLRRAGIPSRVVSGVVYVDSFVGERQVFGYHMWTQALLTGADGVTRWVDLDATLDPDRPFDATHIAISTSSLADGDVVNSMAAMATSLGRLAIEVVETK